MVPDDLVEIFDDTNSSRLLMMGESESALHRPVRRKISSCEAWARRFRLASISDEKVNFFPCRQICTKCDGGGGVSMGTVKKYPARAVSDKQRR